MSLTANLLKVVEELDRLHPGGTLDPAQLPRGEFPTFATAPNGQSRRFTDLAARSAYLVADELRVANPSWESAIEKERFRQLVLQALTDLHVAGALADALGDQAARAKQELRREIAESLARKTVVLTHHIPAVALGFERNSPLQIGPVTVRSRNDWIDAVKFPEGAMVYGGTDAEDVNRSWKEELRGALAKGAAGHPPKGLAGELFGALKNASAVATVSVDGYESALSRKVAEIVCKTALDSIALVCGGHDLFAKQFVAGERTEPPSRYSIVESNGTLHLPGMGLSRRGRPADPAAVDEAIRENKQLMSAISSVVHAVLAPSTGKYPALSNRWATALEWLAEGSREINDAIAVAKLASALDVLSCGGMASGITGMLANLFGLSRSAIALHGPHERTLEQLVEDIYNAGRSKIVHGTEYERLKWFAELRGHAGELALRALAEAAIRLAHFTGTESDEAFRQMPAAPLPDPVPSSAPHAPADPGGAASSPAGEIAFPTECDLVMKGGITSGVVYPRAIKEISRAFRLRSIGGTSAGSIAAAAAAAAELRRCRFKSEHGFDALAQLPDILGGKSASGAGTKLLALFRPSKALRPIFNICVAAIAADSIRAAAVRTVASLFREFWATALVSFLLCTLPVWFSPGSALDAFGSLWLVLLGAAASTIVVLLRAGLLVTKELPKNDFGFCSGMGDTNDPHRAEALTPWLASYLDELAGQDRAFPGQGKPLTFGDLREHGIQLQMMTTCLTLGRPFQLPFRDEENVRENKQFFVKHSDLERLFPDNVVRWMAAKQRKRSSADLRGHMRKVDTTGFLRLPEPADLPVVVAARLSLSFPVLLTAVPLYSIDFASPEGDKRPPQVCWFTDGGLSSDFPIHFFDAPLPTRPTFGIDLGHAEDPDQPRVVFPENNAQARLSAWRRFPDNPGGALFAFLASLLEVAKDWNHDMLSRLPGFRDRIGTVRLTSVEGGLNLTMPAERIQALGNWGAEAGREFVRRFGDARALNAPPSRMNWDNHQSVRLRLLLACISEFLGKLSAGHQTAINRGYGYDRFFDPAAAIRSYPFEGLGKLDMDPSTGLPKSQAGVGKLLLQRLLHSAGLMETVHRRVPGSDPARGAPKPLPELKSRPRT